MENRDCLQEKAQRKRRKVKQRLEEDEVGHWGKSFPGIANGKCKGPEVGTS